MTVFYGFGLEHILNMTDLFANNRMEQTNLRKLRFAAHA